MDRSPPPSSNPQSQPQIPSSNTATAPASAPQTHGKPPTSSQQTPQPYKPTPSVRSKARRSSSHRETTAQAASAAPSSHRSHHGRSAGSGQSAASDNNGQEGQVQGQGQVQPQQQSRYAFLRSKTTLEMRRTPPIPRNEDGLPFVTPVQRYEINLLFMEDVLKVCFGVFCDLTNRLPRLYYLYSRPPFPVIILKRLPSSFFNYYLSKAYA